MASKGRRLPRYRYRTRALIGPWRKSGYEAILDAVGAKQALLEDLDPLRIRWVVPGEIEEEEDKADGAEEDERSSRSA